MSIFRISDVYRKHKVRALQLLFMNHLHFLAELKHLREKHIQAYLMFMGPCIIFIVE